MSLRAPQRCWYGILRVLLAISPVVDGIAQAMPSGVVHPTLANGQSQPALCASGAIDTTFTFADQPAGAQTVSLHFQNTGKSACLLTGPGSASFAVDGHRMVTGNDGQNPDEFDRVLLTPGDKATLDLQWASTGDSCQWADWADISFNWSPPPFDGKKLTSYLFIPAGWPLHICSPVKSLGYRAGMISPSTGSNREGLLHVSILQDPIYSDEPVTLHVETADKNGLAKQAKGCASLYTVRQDPSFGTRFDPLPVSDAPTVPSFTPGQLQEDRERVWPTWKKDRLRRCDVPDGKTWVDVRIGQGSIASMTHVEWSASSSVSGETTFLSAPAHFAVLDVDRLEPNWGKAIDGVRVGLSVDHETVTLGDPLRLHLRWENVDASQPLGFTECLEPQPFLEIEDWNHRFLRTIPMDWDCMGGHGWGPFPVEKGKAAHRFQEVKTGFPSNASPYLMEQGTYYFVTVWSPVVLEPGLPNPLAPTRPVRGKLGAVYATARSMPVKVVVVYDGHKK